MLNKSILPVTVLAALLAVALCSCGTSSPESGGNSPASENVSSASATSDENSISASAPGTTVENDSKAVDQRKEYEAGSVEGDRYVNRTVGIAYPMLDGYSPYDDGRASTEFAIRNDELHRAVFVVYATPVGSGSLEAFVQPCWEERQAAAKNTPNLEVELASMELLDEERPVLISITAYDGYSLYTAQAYFEGNDNICGVFTSATSMDEVMDLLALTEAAG